MTNETQLAEVTLGEVPAFVEGTIHEISKLREKVDAAMDKAEGAENAANKAKENADTAENASVGFWNKKKAIETVRDTVVELSKAQIGAAKAQVAAAEAQKISFEYQRKLGELTKSLFKLGVANIAMNRSVVQELKLKLSGASQEELDDLARREINSWKPSRIR